MGPQQIPVKQFVLTSQTSKGETDVRAETFHENGTLMVIYMKSYGQFIVLDRETFDSMYVQMFILGKYDKDLFELVVSSPYSKIYKLKR